MHGDSAQAVEWASHVFITRAAELRTGFDNDRTGEFTRSAEVAARRRYVEGVLKAKADGMTANVGGDSGRYFSGNLEVPPIPTFDGRGEQRRKEALELVRREIDARQVQFGKEFADTRTLPSLCAQSTEDGYRSSINPIPRDAGMGDRAYSMRRLKFGLYQLIAYHRRSVECPIGLKIRSIQDVAILIRAFMSAYWAEIRPQLGLPEAFDKPDRFTEVFIEPITKHLKEQDISFISERETAGFRFSVETYYRSSTTSAARSSTPLAVAEVTGSGGVAGASVGAGVSRPGGSG